MDFYGSTPLTRHLTPEQVAGVESALEAVPDERVSELVSSLFTAAPFTGPFWEEMPGNHYREWPLVAFKAVKMGRISEMTFATICLLTGMCGEFGYNQMSFTYTDDPLTGAFTTITKSAPDKAPPDRRMFCAIAPDHPDYGKYFGHVMRNLNAWGMDLLSKKMERLPLHDRVVFVVSLPRTPPHTWSRFFTVLQKVIQQYKVAIFDPIEGKTVIPGIKVESRQFVLCSMAVYELFFQTFGVSDRLKQRLLPILGALTREDVVHYQSLFDRVIGVGIPGVLPTPEDADGHPAGEATFSLHDLYHALVNQLRSWPYWAALNRVVHLMQTLPEPLSHDGNVIFMLDRLIDAETFHASKFKASPETFSWVFQSARLKRFWDANPNLKKMIFRDMVDHPHFWRPLLGEKGLCGEDQAYLSSIAAGPPEDDPIPMNMSLHFGFPPGFIERLERHISLPSCPEEAAKERIKAMHTLHFNREQVFAGIEFWMGCLPVGLSYGSLVNALCSPPEEFAGYSSLALGRYFDAGVTHLGDQESLSEYLGRLANLGEEEYRLYKDICAGRVNLSRDEIQQILVNLHSPIYVKHVRRLLPILTTKLPSFLALPHLATCCDEVVDLIEAKVDEIDNASFLGADCQFFFFGPPQSIPSIVYKHRESGEYRIVSDLPKKRACRLELLFSIDAKGYGREYNLGLSEGGNVANLAALITWFSSLTTLDYDRLSERKSVLRAAFHNRDRPPTRCLSCLPFY